MQRNYGGVQQKKKTELQATKDSKTNSHLHLRIASHRRLRVLHSMLQNFQVRQTSIFRLLTGHCRLHARMYRLQLSDTLSLHYYRGEARLDEMKHC